MNPSRRLLSNITTRIALLSPCVLFLIFPSFCVGANASQTVSHAQIVIGSHATDMEIYAARELARYLFERTGQAIPIRRDSGPMDTPTFLIGGISTNRYVAQLHRKGELNALDSLGSQGYLLKSFSGRPGILVISGGSPTGTLYGVYGLLTDFYGVSFSFAGDVMPVKKIPLFIPKVNESVTPRQTVRGVLPWTNFPQSATSYSFRDYKYVIDQMAKMRMNLLNLHNYTGDGGHDEMFSDWEWHGILSRVWMATAATGHGWNMPGWKVRKYRFGAGDLFDDYDAGSDCTLHNSGLSNWQTFRKGVSLLQRVIAYAHTRGVRIALGIDIDTLPLVYNAKVDDPSIVKARTDQIIHDYPHLDYFICYLAEGRPNSEQWHRIFNEMYAEFKKKAPQIKIAVSGWGLSKGLVDALPADVIVAPISPYSAGFESGAIYEPHQYWGCPWMERDGDSSLYYYPYNMNLSDTIAAYQRRAPNMTGFQTLTWRLTDAVDAKIEYIAQAPWDIHDHLASSETVYSDYAKADYGAKAAPFITPIINQNEAFATGASECEVTAKFTNANRSKDIDKAKAQLRVIDRCIAQAKDPGDRFRLELLRDRIDAVEAYDELDQNFENTPWNAMPGAFRRWVHDFTHRVIDISSLGNVVSAENRYVQLRYLPRVTQLREEQDIKAPSHVRARGDLSGAMITWKNEEPRDALGFFVYRDGKRITRKRLPPSTTSYHDDTGGYQTYRVRCAVSGGLSPMSLPSSTHAGRKSDIPPRVIVISPPTSCGLRQNASIEARILSDRTYGSVHALFAYRHFGERRWRTIRMARRCKSIFAVTIPGSMIGSAGLEYYIMASDGVETGRYPVTAPSLCASIILDPAPETRIPEKVTGLRRKEGGFVWNPVKGAFWYRIYRSTSPVFQPGRANYVTYVAGDTTEFKDLDGDFDGETLHGAYYYRITAMTEDGVEGTPSSPLRMNYARIGKDAFMRVFACDYDHNHDTRNAPSTDGSCVGFISNGSWLEYDQLNFGKGASAVSFRVAAALGTGGSIEIHLDALNGPLLGVCKVASTGDWQKWVDLRAPVKFVKGVHDLYLKFTGGAGYLINVEWFHFIPAR